MVRQEGKQGKSSVSHKSQETREYLRRGWYSTVSGAVEGSGRMRAKKRTSDLAIEIIGDLTESNFSRLVESENRTY